MPVSNSIRILTISRDVSLLSSRANLLTQAGYSADSEVNQDRALRRIRTHPYHLIIISNSYAQEEQLGLRTMVKQVKPDANVLLLGDDEDRAEPFLQAVRTGIQRSKGKLVSDVASVSAP